jgi:DNA-binding response OmpR family regulator
VRDKLENTVILVLEDEPLIAWDLESALTEAGFMVALARSCLDAEKWLTDHCPDAAVLDLKLGDGECVAVAKSLVERDVPFIVHTGDDLFGRDEVFKSGTVVAKPADTPAIVELARSMLAQRLAGAVQSAATL